MVAMFVRRDAIAALPVAISGADGNRGTNSAGVWGASGKSWRNGDDKGLDQE
jgi:hypothetical protein